MKNVEKDELRKIKNEMKEENHAYKYKMFHRDPLSCFYL